MKVLVIPSWYPSGEDKLMGIYHKEFCCSLALQKDIQVDMLYIERERLKNPIKYLFMKKKDIIDEKGYRVFIYRIINFESISFDYAMKIYYKKLDKAFKDYTNRFGYPDVLHAEVTIPAGYAVCKLGEKYHIPVIVTEHASYFEKFFQGSFKKYGEYVLNHSYFTTVSNYMKDIMLKKIPQCDVIPNIVDTSLFNIKKKKRKGLNLVTVGAFRKGKRIDDIIKALRIILDENPNMQVKLSIIGDGYLKDRYKEIIKELRLENNVAILGQKTKEEIADILSEQDIFVVASLAETFCIPGIEALASGIPVVATKSGGPDEYITEDCGILADKDNPLDLAQKIMIVYQKLDSYNPSKLRKIAERYSKEKVISDVINIYKKVSK